MSDVFLSYSSKDRDLARRVVKLLLDHGWSVWWDRGIPVGAEWAPELEQALARTRAVLVLWSPNSRASEWVHHEALIGAEKGALFSVLLDGILVPTDFAQHQACDLSKWEGDPKFAEAEALLTGLAALVPPSRLRELRPGFDPAFISKRKPLGLPAVTGPAVVLRYVHFTVVMHPGRRLAHYVAYNVAGEQFSRVDSEVRQEWTADPMVPRSTQITVALTTRSEYHRGHLVAPQTVCWGEPVVAETAARHAMFLPNISPQHADVNLGSWLALEKWERGLALSHKKIIGFSGPVFAADDAAFRGEMDLEDGVKAMDSFRLPQHFWKLVIAMPSTSAGRGGLQLAAYLVANTSKDKVGAAPQRIELKELEARTGLRFSEVYHQAKAMAGL